MVESVLEDALLSKLQGSLLELGHGFCFEARQNRLLSGETYNFVELVFCHRISKCHVLVELLCSALHNKSSVASALMWRRAEASSDRGGIRPNSVIHAGT